MKNYKFKKGDTVQVIKCINISDCDSIGLSGKIKTIEDDWVVLSGKAGRSHSVYKTSELILVKPLKKAAKKEKAAENRIYFGVFTKLAKDPDAIFITRYHAEKYCDHMLKVNIHTKFTIQVIDSLSFKYVTKVCKSCGHEIII